MRIKVYSRVAQFVRAPGPVLGVSVRLSAARLQFPAHGRMPNFSETRLLAESSPLPGFAQLSCALARYMQ